MRNWLTLILLICCLSGLLLSGCASKQAVEKAIRENPEMVLDVLKENKLLVLEVVQQAVAEEEANARAAQWQAQLEDPLQPVVQGDRPMRGDFAAPVLVAEFSDMLCPYCARGHATMVELKAKRPEVRMIFKHFPLHDESRKLAKLFEAVARQDEDKAWAFLDMVFAAQKQVSEEGASGNVVTAILNDLEVDAKQLAKDLQDPAIDARIDADAEEARNFGFRGTPTYVVGGIVAQGAAPLDQFETLVDMVLAKQAGIEDCPTCTAK